MSSEPSWITKNALLLLHKEASPSSADQAEFWTKASWSLPSPIAATPLLTTPAATLVELAASYCSGFAKNHAFVDGNRRAALLCVGAFLAINGFRLTAPQVDAIQTTLRVAAATISEPDVAPGSRSIAKCVWRTAPASQSKTSV